MAKKISIDHLWNGEPCLDERVFATLELSQVSQGLHVKAEAPILHEQKVPDAPIGSRVEGLWQYDVVELFLVGPGHRYFELELGAGGHYLALSFDSIRHRSDDHENFHPVLHYEKTPEKKWISELMIPQELLPENIRAMNAFVIAAGQFLSMSPLPGNKPDFHQPDFFLPFRFDTF